MHPSASVFEQIISKPRLDSYRAYWKVGPQEAVGLYMWNVEVCAEMGKLLQHLEVALRNNIHRELSLHVTANAASSTAWWDVLSGQLSADAKKNIGMVRDKAYPVVPGADEIVSRLSFGFWPNLLNWIAKQRTLVMPAILPGHPMSQTGANPDWAVKSARGAGLQPFFELKDVRNRIAHREPLWKFSKVEEAVAGRRTTVPASAHEASTIARFNRLLAIYDRAVHDVSPLLQQCIRGSSWRARLDFLLSPRGLDRYRCGGHVTDSATLSTQAFRQQLATVIQCNRPRSPVRPRRRGHLHTHLAAWGELPHDKFPRSTDGSRRR